MSTPTLPPPIRTTITLLLAWGVVIFGCHISEVKDVSRNTWVFLILSGLSTGLSWIFQGDPAGRCFPCGADRQAERGDHHSACLSLPARTAVVEGRHRCRADCDGQYLYDFMMGWGLSCAWKFPPLFCDVSCDFRIYGSHRFFSDGRPSGYFAFTYRFVYW